MEQFVDLYLLPYMTLKRPNRRHSVYAIKTIIERETKQYISLENLQDYLAKCGYPVSDFYPVSERFFRR